MLSLPAMMNKSMWTSFLMELAPEDAVRRFAELGWTHLELSTEHGAALLDRGDPAATGEEFRRFCSGIGVSLPQGHLKLSAKIGETDACARRREVDELKRWLDLFAAIGVRAAVLHPGGGCLNPGPVPEEVFHATVESLGELVAHTGGGPPVICLENGPNASGLLEIIEAVGSEGLGICFDTGHLAVLRAQAPEVTQTEREFILEAGDRLKALHIADNDGSGDQHLLPYDGGAVDWPGVMCGLGEISYEGPFNFEVPGESRPDRCPLERRPALLARAAAIADRMMETMRQSVA